MIMLQCNMLEEIRIGATTQAWKRKGRTGTYPSIFVYTSNLSSCYSNFVWMNGNAIERNVLFIFTVHNRQPSKLIWMCKVLPFNTICVTKIMALSPLIIIEQYYNRCNEIYNFPGREKVNIGSTVPPTVTISLQPSVKVNIPQTLQKDTEEILHMVKVFFFF